MKSFIVFIILSLNFLTGVYSQTVNFYYDRGVKLIEEKKYNDAIKDFDYVIKNYPDYFEAYNGRALCKINAGEIEDAIND